MAVLSMSRFRVKVAVFSAPNCQTLTRPQRAAKVWMAVIFFVMITMLPITVPVLTELQLLT